MRNKISGKFEKLPNEDYLKRVENKFGDTFQLNEIKFVGENVIVFCKKHGEFSKNKHDFLRSKGCPSCARKKTSVTDWVKISQEKHNDMFDYSLVDELNGSKPVPIICKEHGVFNQNPMRHKAGANGCKPCSLRENGLKRRKGQEEILSEFKEVHGECYDYSNVKYISVKQKVDITCIDHGVFSQTPDNHLQGQGCPLCSLETPYKKSSYILKCKKTKGRSNIYIILCYNEEERFVKIGITNTKLSVRYSKGDSLPYNHTRLLFLESGAGEVWQLERDLLKQLSNYKYTPKFPFAGMTECVVEDISEIIRALDLLCVGGNDVARKAKVELLKHFPCLEEVLNK